mmetsp:Transcript_8977/g.20751  ORF Transcript_8977/g.20751 Transcript_8977/m.20751 type:complete len:121 (+) Transcript_8977:199-561(+)
MNTKHLPGDVKLRSFIGFMSEAKLHPDKSSLKKHATMYSSLSRFFPRFPGAVLVFAKIIDCATAPSQLGQRKSVATQPRQEFQFVRRHKRDACFPLWPTSRHQLCSTRRHIILTLTIYDR